MAGDFRSDRIRPAWYTESLPDRSSRARANKRENQAGIRGNQEASDDDPHVEAEVADRLSGDRGRERRGDAPLGGSVPVATIRDTIHTVAGQIERADLGVTLMHEHVLVDFIGADQVMPARYDADAVFRRALPHLQQREGAGRRDARRVHAGLSRARPAAARAARRRRPACTS